VGSSTRTASPHRLTRAVFALERALLLLDSEEREYERDRFLHYIPEESRVTVSAVEEARREVKRRQEWKAIEETREFDDV